MSNSRQRAANLTAALRHLAAANLPGKLAWEAAGPILNRLVPADECGLFWGDMDGGVADFQIESSRGLEGLQAYLREGIAQKNEVGGFDDSIAFMHAGPVAQQLSGTPAYERSAFHEYVVRPLDLNHMARFAIRPRAAPPICLFRGRENRRSLGESEITRMTALLPLLGHMLSARGLAPDTAAVATGGATRDDEALLIVDRTGHIEYSSSAAIHHACRAAGLNMRASTLIDPDPRPLRPLLRELAERAFRLDAGRETALPEYVARQPTGVYALRAYRLHDRSRCRALAAVQIELRRPLLVRLYRAGVLQTLSPREQQLATLLLDGYSIPAAAEKLGLRKQTAASYADNLYHRLGISKREDLLPVLLGRPLQPLS